MSITKMQEYKFILLLALAERGDNFVSLTEIAKEKNLPLPFLRTIAGELLRKGFLISKEGKSGGYKLKKPPHEISFSEILSSDRFFNIPCQRGSCSLKGACPLSKTWTEAEVTLQSLFSRIYLNEFVDR